MSMSGFTCDNIGEYKARRSPKDVSDIEPKAQDVYKSKSIVLLRVGMAVRTHSTGGEGIRSN
jgi:hypothetical protein